eukprot:TRINITY_DN11282_c0_g1_i4.p1 TRINITY_DN11282_c0_g1~~TRINITY_DN11282_c0_g1_i4.p1  ORF type:complete len:294 (-),score=65.13 TRINITY_DN11282_c0_g1_i4:103-984(-)
MLMLVSRSFRIKLPIFLNAISWSFYRKMADYIINKERTGDWNQALMELGATVCVPVKPSCGECPVRKHCLAFSRFAIDQKMHNREPKLTDASNRAIPRSVEANCQYCGDLKSIESADGYPLKSKKKEQRKEYVASCILKVKCVGEKESKLHLLLIKRPESGLLASMMEFPTREVSESSSYKARQQIIDDYLEIILPGFTVCGDEMSAGLVLKRRIDVGQIIHNFTHIQQTIFVELLELGATSLPAISPTSPGSKWASIDSFKETAISTGMLKAYQLMERMTTPPTSKRKASKA